MLMFLQRPDWRQILECLAKIKANGEYRINDLVNLSQDKVSQRSTVIILTTSNELLRINDFLSLQDKKTRIIIVFIDMNSFKRSKQSLTGKELKRLLQKFSENRVITYVCKKGDSLEECLKKPFPFTEE